MKADDRKLVARAAVALLADRVLCGVLRASLDLDEHPLGVRERCQELVADVLACGGAEGRVVRLAVAILTSGEEI